MFGMNMWKYDHYVTASNKYCYYSDVIMGAMASQITSLTISKKISNPRVTGLCEEISPVTGEFPAQRTNNAENVSIWWRHHVKYDFVVCGTTHNAEEIPEQYGNMENKLQREIAILVYSECCLTICVETSTIYRFRNIIHRCLVPFNVDLTIIVPQIFLPKVVWRQQTTCSYFGTCGEIIVNSLLVYAWNSANGGQVTTQGRLHTKPPGKDYENIDVMTLSNGNIFRITGLLSRELTGHLWIPLTEASDAEPWCFVWSE